MKRFGFLAVTGAAALAAGFTLPTAALAKPVVRLKVLETDWVMAHANPIWFKRYFVMNAFKGSNTLRPHIADAVTLSFEEWYGPNREALMKERDLIAFASLKNFIENATVTSPNVVLFTGDDCLPVCRHPQ